MQQQQQQQQQQPFIVNDDDKEADPRCEGGVPLGDKSAEIRVNDDLIKWN